MRVPAPHSSIAPISAACVTVSMAFLRTTAVSTLEILTPTADQVSLEVSAIARAQPGRESGLNIIVIWLVSPIVKEVSQSDDGHSFKLCAGRQSERNGSEVLYEFGLFRTFRDQMDHRVLPFRNEVARHPLCVVCRRARICLPYLNYVTYAM